MPDKHPTRILPSVEYLRQCLVYYPESGELRWRERPLEHFFDERVWKIWNTRFAWKITGCVAGPHGNLIVRLDACNYLAHRLAWKLFTGEEPAETIDHIDFDPANNQWENLRPATQGEQTWHRRDNRNNTTGRRGVNPLYGGRWEAKIMINGVLHRRRFDTPEEASAQYEAWARKAHGEFYRKSF